MIGGGNADCAGYSKKSLKENGNWRITNKIDHHNVRYMRADFAGDDATDQEAATIALAVLLAISVVVALVLGVCACRQLKDQSADSVEQVDASPASAVGGDKVENEGGERVVVLDDPSEEVKLQDLKMAEGVIDNV